ncbi:MAG: bifunctional YncE family protein/alkaline phosphatase family protein [Armatimonadetes bacterium]|nr:bifunctional YncE family protein/alkaline phosphatase family protein [Armatimonadota bacterium]
MRVVRTRVVVWTVVAVAALASSAMWVGEVVIGPQTDGSVLVPTGQRLTRVGLWHTLANERPKDLAVSPDGTRVAVLTARKVVVLDATGEVVSEAKQGGGPLGIAWRPDGEAVYVSAGANVLEIGVKQREAAVVRKHAVESASQRPAGTPSDPQAAGLGVSPDGLRLYVALGTRNSIAVLDPLGGAAPVHVAVGVCPYHVALSRDGGTLWVSNRGGARVKPGRSTASSAGTAVRIERRTDAALRGSVTIVDTRTLTGTEVAVGRQPAGIALAGDGARAYVANSDSDTVSIVDAPRRQVSHTFAIGSGTRDSFGHMPTGVALSEDERTLYVACGGANALAVIRLGPNGRPDAASESGYIPTAWYPIAVRRQGGALWIACSKGTGAHGDLRQGGRWVHASAGVVQRLDPTDMAPLGPMTAQVQANNRWDVEPRPRSGMRPVPVPERVGEPSVFRHVVYVIKENHTYDMTLGDMKEGNGDPKLCMFGEEVTPNQHAIARQFVLLDNTYTSGTNSADGHQWTSSAVCNAYMEQNYSSYARSYPYDGGDPLAYSPKGFLWTAAASRGLSVRVFGEYVNRPRIEDTQDPKRKGRPSWTELWKDYRSGGNRFRILAETDNAALRKYLHPRCIGFPMNVSDQWRADQYIADLREWERAGKMPSLSIILLPNNHTAGTTPGMPTPRATVADNDLAFGRIVDAISHSRFWPETLILCIEDDSQLGVDHVDGHRTIAYCVSPYTRRGAVVSSLYDHTSLLRTIGLVLGIPALNQFDRAGRPMRDCFQATADLRPYSHVPNRIALDEMNKPAAVLRGEPRRLAEACSRLDWSDLDRSNGPTVAKAVWLSQKPGVRWPAELYKAETAAE